MRDELSRSSSGRFARVRKARAEAYMYRAGPAELSAGSDVPAFGAGGAPWVAICVGNLYLHWRWVRRLPRIGRLRIHLQPIWGDLCPYDARDLNLDCFAQLHGRQQRAAGSCRPSCGTGGWACSWPQLHPSARVRGAQHLHERRRSSRSACSTACGRRTWTRCGVQHHHRSQRI